MSLKEAEVLALSTLKQVMEEKVGRRWEHWHGVRGAGVSSARQSHQELRSLVADLELACKSPGQHCAKLPLNPVAMQVTATNVDIARVAPKWHLYTPEEVEEVIARL